MGEEDLTVPSPMPLEPPVMVAVLDKKLGITEGFHNFGSRALGNRCIWRSLRNVKDARICRFAMGKRWSYIYFPLTLIQYCKFGFFVFVSYPGSTKLHLLSSFVTSQRSHVQSSLPFNQFPSPFIYKRNSGDR